MFTHITDHRPPHPHSSAIEALACEDELEIEAMEAAWISAEEQVWADAFVANETPCYEVALEGALVG